MIKQMIYLFVIFLGMSFSVFSQKEERKQLREGNSLYNKEKYTEAEITYQKALEVNNRSTIAAYNLGNSLYKQEKYTEALKQYEVVTNTEKDKPTLAKTWHNIGNIMASAKDYSKAIEAYKRSLINNPKDHETRYNLAVAQKLLNDQKKDQDNKDDQKKDDKDKKDDQEKKQDQKQDEQQQKQDQQNQEQNANMNKEKAQQILDALAEDEKKTQSKVKEEEAKGRQGHNKSEKDW